jgi:hypothetical protein
MNGLNTNKYVAELARQAKSEANGYLISVNNSLAAISK